MKKGEIHFEVIVGTYEEFILGYQYMSSDELNKGELVQTFATHSHRASVRSIASKGQLVVSGGADETINIYNMLTRKECGMLMENNGTITSLNFTPDCSHLISTSEDGSIKIFRQGSWQLEKDWPSAHKGTAVTCLAVHPSGKMALSVGKDYTLRTWNLVKGRPAYTTNLFSRCRQLENVVWSPGGVMFAIPMDSKLELNSTEKGGVLHTLQFPSKVTACAFLSDEVVCVGDASGMVSCYSTDSSTLLWSLPGEQRVRGIAFLHSHLVVATSTGSISVYSVVDVSKQPLISVTEDTGCRITCLTLFDYKSVIKIKKEPSDEDKPPSTDETGATNTAKRKDNVLRSEEEKLYGSTEKKKVKNSVLKPGKVICSPGNQKWFVENSKR